MKKQARLAINHNNAEWGFIALTTVRAKIPGTFKTVKVHPGMPMPEAVTFGKGWDSVHRMVRIDSKEFEDSLKAEEEYKEEFPSYLTAAERYHASPLGYKDDIYPLSCRKLHPSVVIDEDDDEDETEDDVKADEKPDNDENETSESADEDVKAGPAKKSKKTEAKKTKRTRKKKSEE